MPIIKNGQSDTASLDNALELLISTGRTIEHSMMMLIPEAWGDHIPMAQKKKDFCICIYLVVIMFFIISQACSNFMFNYYRNCKTVKYFEMKMLAYTTSNILKSTSLELLRTCSMYIIDGTSFII